MSSPHYAQKFWVNSRKDIAKALHGVEESGRIAPTFFHPNKLANALLHRRSIAASPDTSGTETRLPTRFASEAEIYLLMMVFNCIHKNSSRTIFYIKKFPTFIPK